MMRPQYVDGICVSRRAAAHLPFFFWKRFRQHNPGVVIAYAVTGSRDIDLGDCSAVYPLSSQGTEPVNPGTAAKFDSPKPWTTEGDSGTIREQITEVIDQFGEVILTYQGKEHAWTTSDNFNFMNREGRTLNLFDIEQAVAAGTMRLRKQLP